MYSGKIAVPPGGGGLRVKLQINFYFNKKIKDIVKLVKHLMELLLTIILIISHQRIILFRVY
jgi:hypothetical protein